MYSYFKNYHTPTCFDREADMINPLNAELNPICHLLALLGANHILHISKIRVKLIVAIRSFANAPQNQGQ
jgi:hypothetical protein